MDSLAQPYANRTAAIGLGWIGIELGSRGLKNSEWWVHHRLLPPPAGKHTHTAGEFDRVISRPTRRRATKSELASWLAS